MAKKEEAPDKFGVIKKQSEVWVWNDQVYASYKAAVIASKKTRIIEKIIERMYPNYTATQKANTVAAWSASPTSYSVYGSVAIAVFSDLLEEFAGDLSE